MQNPSGGKTALGLDTNVGALLCYLPVCWINAIYSIIVLVTEKTDKVMRFHAFQSLLLTGAMIVGIVVVAVVGGILVAITGSGILGSLVFLLYCAVALGYIIAEIMGCIKGYQGQQYKFPIVGDMAEKWANG
jgi:uncharacterized membrane protein